MTTAPEPSICRYYRLSNLVLKVSGSAISVLDAVHARLRWAAVESGPSPDFEIHFELTDVLPDWLSGLECFRRVLDHPSAQIYYDQETDRMLATFGDEGAALVEGQLASANVQVRRNGGREEWLGSHPLFTVALTELIRRRGLFSLHAAGAAIDGRAVLLAGASGVGKSTLSIALARRGFEFLSDDRIFIQMRDAKLEILPFPDDIDLRDGTPGLFAELRPILDTPKPAGWPKWKLSAESFYDSAVPPCCEPGLLLFPSISDSEESEVEEMSSHEALLDLVPNVVLTHGPSAQMHLDVLTTLARSSRCFRLRTGRDFDVLADRLRELLSRPLARLTT